MWAALPPSEYYDRSVPPGPPGRTARLPITAGSSTARRGRDPSGSHVHFVPVLTGGTRLYPGGHHGARRHAPWSAPSDWMPPEAGACLSRQPGPHRIPVPHPPGSRRFWLTRRRTPVPHVSLRESLAGPARSGSTRTSRRCQGRLPPPRQRFLRRDGCPQLRPAAATTEPRGPLTPVRKRSASWRTSMAQWPRAQEATASGRAWSMGREQNRVDHLGGLLLGPAVPARAPALRGGCGASDPHHLGGAGQVDPLGGLDGLDGAPHPPPVAGVDARDGRDVLPGQGPQLPFQARPACP